MYRSQSAQISCQLAILEVTFGWVSIPLKPDGFPGIIEKGSVQRLKGAQLAHGPFGRLFQLLGPPCACSARALCPCTCFSGDPCGAVLIGEDWYFCTVTFQVEQVPFQGQPA